MSLINRFRQLMFDSGQNLKLPSKPRSTMLLNESAVDVFFEGLNNLVDTDLVLQKADKTRSDLRELMYDDEISTALETRQASIETTPWRLEPGEGKVTEFIWEQLESNIENLVSGAFSAVPFGYSVIELIYYRSGSNLKIRSVGEKPFEWFTPTNSGGLIYNRDFSSEGEPVDTYYKFLLTRRKPSYYNPRGEALLSRLYWPWFFRGKGWVFWAKFLERFGSPFMVGKTAGDTGVMATALASAVQSATIAVGSEDEVLALSPSADGGSFERFQVAIDKRIQKVVLGQTLTTDTQGVGSQALGNVHNLVRQDRRAADLKMVGTTIQNFINALCSLNFPGSPVPTFVYDPGTGLQIDRAERDAKLTQAGVLRFTEQYLIDRYDFEVGDFEVGPSQANLNPSNSIKASYVGPHNKFSSENGRFSPGQNAIEDLVEKAFSQAPQPINPEKLKSIILSAESPEDLVNKLTSQIGGDFSSDQFSEIVERALFAADLMGYSHSADGA